MAAINKRPNGSWQAKIRRNGWPAQSKSFKTKAAAEAWVRAIEREMDVGIFVRRDDADRMTFGMAAQRYRTEVLPTKRGRAQDEYVLNRVTEEFGEYGLMSMTPALLSEYRDTRLQAVGPQTVLHELGMVSRVFQAVAIDWRIPLPQGNPVAMVRKPRPGAERTRRVEPGEEELLMSALGECAAPWPAAAALLAIETAARMSELLSLQWIEVDLERRVARIRGKAGGITKSGEPFRDVPLSRRAVAMLTTLPRHSSGRVLPLSQNALQMAWERACARARRQHVHRLLRTALGQSGVESEKQDAEFRALVYKKRAPMPLTLELLDQIESKDKVMVDLHFHDLRHEATTRLADRLAMHELMKVTGHRTSRMLARYYHPKAEVLALKLD